MKTIFRLTIFSLIILLSCGKSEEEKAKDDVKKMKNKFIEEEGSEWGEIIDYENIDDYTK